jgi:hypothetical protein
MNTPKASFQISADEYGFTHSETLPLKKRGFAKELKEDMKRAFEIYELRHSVRELEEENTHLKDALREATHHLSMNRKEVVQTILINALTGVTSGKETQ